MSVSKMWVFRCDKERCDASASYTANRNENPTEELELPPGWSWVRLGPGSYELRCPDHAKEEKK